MDRLARIVTEVFAPAVLIAAQLVAVGFHSGQPWLGALAAVFAAAIPFAYIVRQVRRGRLTDHHIVRREQRHLPLGVGVASVLTGLVLLVVAGAPGELLALVAAGAVGLAACATVTRWWKMSIHSAVAAGTVVVLTLVYGGPLLATAAVAALIGWARVRLEAHTVAQVLVGAAVGATIAGAVFGSLR
jgi:membrane-associated phospholipid phosphatase